MQPVFVVGSFVLLVLGWLVPGKFLPWVSFQNEALAFLAVLLGAWTGIAVSFRKDGIEKIGIPMAAVPFLALAVVAILQGATGAIAFWGDVWMFLLYLSLCLVCLTLGFSATSPTLRRFSATQPATLQTATAITLLVGAVISAVMALAQVLEVWQDSGWVLRLTTLRRPGANLSQPNHLATLELAGIASLIFLNHARKLGRLSMGAIFALLCVSLAATESRTGALGFVAMICWWFVKRKQVGFTISPWTASVSTLCFLLLFWWWPYFLHFVQISGADTGVNVSGGLRLVVWPQLLEAAVMRPWWGWGIREVAKAHNSVAHEYALSDSFSYSHNIFLDLILGVGLPLTVLLLLLSGVWLWRRVKAANQLSSWYSLAVVLPLALHSMLEFPFAYAYFLVPAMFLLGTMEGELGVQPLVRVEKWYCVVFLSLFMLVGGRTGFEYFQAEEDFRMARFENLRIGQTPLDYQRPKLVLLTQLGALRDSIRMPPEPGMSKNDIETVRHVALHYPSGAPLSRYVLVLALNGNPEEAIRQARVLRVLLGEGAYMRLKLRFEELALNDYPQLRDIKLP